MIKFSEKHKLIVKYILFVYIVFNSCMSFPFGSERFPLDFSKLYLILFSYGIIAFIFTSVYDGKKYLAVYIQSLVFTVLGLVCRYFLEYGEVSNTYNFTIFNIVAYLVLIPIFVVFTYSFVHFIAQKSN